MPYRNEVRVEPNRETDPTELITFSSQYSSPQEHSRGLITSIKTSLQLLSNSHQLHSRPEVWSVGLLHSERPASAIYVPSIFPHWLEALLEQVYRLPHLDLINRRIVIVSPEVLDRLNLRPNFLQRRIIGSICRFLLVFLLSFQVLATARVWTWSEPVLI